MQIDWNNFTPWMSLAGGILVGLASAAFLLLNGRIAGISGLLGGLLRAPAGERGWRMAFLGGLVAAPLVYALAAPLPGVEVDAGFSAPATARAAPAAMASAAWRAARRVPTWPPPPSWRRASSPSICCGT